MIKSERIGCVVEGCPGEHKQRGLCAHHYAQRYYQISQFGSTEIPILPPERLSERERFDKYTPNRPDNGCWIWTGQQDGMGYGKLTVGTKGIDRRQEKAHRLSYEYFIGPIPEGLQIDHLCKVRSCVAPIHLQAVTQATNMLRGDAPCAKNMRKTHCPYGHEYNDENTYYNEFGNRRCRVCVLSRSARNKDKDVMLSKPKKRKNTTRSHVPEDIDFGIELRRDAKSEQEYRSRFNSPGQRKWTLDVLHAAKFKCLRCGSETDLQAHHILSYANHPELRADVANGACLCKECHTEFHVKYPPTHGHAELVEFLTTAAEASATATN